MYRVTPLFSVLFLNRRPKSTAVRVDPGPAHIRVPWASPGATPDGCADFRSALQCPAVCASDPLTVRIAPQHLHTLYLLHPIPSLVSFPYPLTARVSFWIRRRNNTIVPPAGIVKVYPSMRAKNSEPCTTWLGDLPSASYASHLAIQPSYAVPLIVTVSLFHNSRLTARALYLLHGIVGSHRYCALIA